MAAQQNSGEGRRSRSNLRFIVVVNAVERTPTAQDGERLRALITEERTLGLALISELSWPQRDFPRLAFPRARAGCTSEEAREMAAKGEGMWSPEAKQRAADAVREMVAKGEGAWSLEVGAKKAQANRARAFKLRSQAPAGKSCSGGCGKTFAVWVGRRGCLCNNCSAVRIKASRLKKKAMKAIQV